MNSKLLSWFLLFILTLIWGSSFILIKWGLIAYSSIEAGSIRLTASFIILLPFAISRFKRIPRNKWKYLIFTGIIGNGAPAYLYAEAITHIDSLLGAIINTLIPLFTLIISILFYKFKNTKTNTIGILLGLLGAIGLLSVAGDSNIVINYRYGSYIMLANLCISFNLNIIKKDLKDIDTITISSYIFLFAGIPAIIYLLLFSNIYSSINNHPNGISSLIYLCILGIFGSAFATILLNKLIQISTPLIASSVTYTIPIIAIIWGIADGEIFKLSYLFWIPIIILGVYFVNKRHKIINNVNIM